ncbi:MAG: hypothetical protein M1821_000667 [Bathelium mastoideum]|nr:MAG: hypothetical protein M1821_000667 [Bathelium mastoideum]
MPYINDLCPLTSPTNATSTNNFQCPTHADSLEDCMNQCSAAHPLCLAVSYAPAMVAGYANCYFKSNISTADIIPSGGEYIHHMAIINNDVVFDTDSSCINGSTYTSPNQAKFEVDCNKEAPTGNVVTAYHVESLDACADACAAYTNSSGVTCLLAVFDSTLEFGYLNCYLQSNLTASNAKNGYHLAFLTQAANGTLANSTSSTPGNSTASSSASPLRLRSNRAWVAGPVVGIVLGAVAVGGLLFWSRRRQRLPEPDQHSLAPMPQGGAEHAPLAELDYEGQKHELP